MTSLTSLVYESRAIAPLSEPDLRRLVAVAQARNRKEGVTGLLIYDDGRFMQWLEGPVEGVARVWQSIRQDRRHTALSLLGASSTPLRVFGDSPMALGKRRAQDTVQWRSDIGVAAVELPAELIETLYQSPQSAPSVLAGLARQPANEVTSRSRPAGVLADADRMSLQALVHSVIVPELVVRHALPVLALPIIDPHAAELARLLVAAEPKAAFALIDSLRADGRSIAQLCAGLFEPAARALGELWQVDDCSDFEVTLGLGHLRLALRRASLELPFAAIPLLPASMPRAVLVAPSPKEPHLLGSAVASEMFWRAGWDVSCEFPTDDAALGQLVHDRWFDVLDLSLSGAFTREHRLPAMAASIRAAHAHSRNPALAVIVDGRIFRERPQAYAEVGADASSNSALDVVSTAQRQTSSPVAR